MILRSLFVFFVLCIFSSTSSFAEKNGITGRTSSLVGCAGSGCHASTSSSATTVTVISRSGSFEVIPGGQLDLTVIVAHASQKFAGFNLAIKTTANGSTNSGGTFTTGTGSKVQLSEITHSAPKTFTNGKAEFVFSWKAPTKEGTYILQTVGNATNGTNGAWNFAKPIQVVVKAASSVNEDFTAPILSAYPNPAISQITIDYTITESAEYQFLISDITGRTVYFELSRMMLNGNYSTAWNCQTTDGSSIGNGQYFAILRSDKQTFSVPFVVAR